MPSQWFYKKQGATFGPVTTHELKALAASAEIATTDLVWKEGMAAWVAASGLKGLFAAAPVASTPTPPPLLIEPPNPQSVAAPTIGSRLKSAGKLAAAQANRTKLATINLPQAYRELGRQIQKSGQFRDELPDLYCQFDELTASMTSITNNAAARPTAEGFAGKAKATAIAAKEMAQSKGVELRITQIMGRLGEAAFEKKGEQAGPPDLIRSIKDFRLQIANLDVEIAQLSRSNPGQVFTPKRIVLIAVCLIALAGIGILGKIASQDTGSASKGSDKDSPQAAAPSGEQARHVPSNPDMGQRNAAYFSDGFAAGVEEIKEMQVESNYPTANKTENYVFESKCRASLAGHEQLRDSALQAGASASISQREAGICAGIKKQMDLLGVKYRQTK